MTEILPGIHPKSVKMIFSSTAHVQHPFSIATATGGKNMTKIILQTSMHVTAIFKRFLAAL